MPFEIYWIIFHPSYLSRCHPAARCECPPGRMDRNHIPCSKGLAILCSNPKRSAFSVNLKLNKHVGVEMCVVGDKWKAKLSQNEHAFHRRWQKWFQVIGLGGVLIKSSGEAVIDGTQCRDGTLRPTQPTTASAIRANTYRHNSQKKESNSGSRYR